MTSYHFANVEPRNGRNHMRKGTVAMKRSRIMYGMVGVALTAGLLTSCAEPAATPEDASVEPSKQQQAVAATGSAESADWLSTMFGEELVKADGAKVVSKTLSGKKVGIYFSAHWCPPCRSFTPVLVKTYKELVAADKPFEIVFVSFDRNAGAMKGYMEEAGMPWVAVPFESPLRESLAEKYGVRGIPTLVVLDEKGNTVTKDARGDVASGGAAAFDKW